MALSPTTSRGSSSSAGALTLLSSTTLAAPGDFDVTGIAATYNDLVLSMVLRGAAVAASDTPQLRFNGDSGANYYQQYVRGTGTTAQAAEALSQTYSTVTGTLNAASGTANYWSHATAEILGYASTTWVKVVRTESGNARDKSTGLNFAVFMGTIWDSTAAINRIQLLALSGSGFAIGSQLRVYGRL
jgi:hypothetical protein